jgi:hypothetical protein
MPVSYTHVPQENEAPAVAGLASSGGPIRLSLPPPQDQGAVQSAGLSTEARCCRFAWKQDFGPRRSGPARSRDP